MARKITEKVKAVVKRVTTKRAPVKEVVETTNVCQECNGRGLKDAHTLCAPCAGSGQV